MIGVRTPFRVSFMGGGSDLPDFYRRRPGRVISTTIDKYMYVLVHRFFDERIQVKYMRTEIASKPSEVAHPIVRAVLERFGVTGIDINSIADIPAGTGLGSSSAFTVGILNALYAYTGRLSPKAALAREACEIEIDILKEPIGKQDQFSSAFGGFNVITFHPDESVTVEPVILKHEIQSEFQEWFQMYYLGDQRATSVILKDQTAKLRSDEKSFELLGEMADAVYDFRDALMARDFWKCGTLLHEGWLKKRRLSSKISDSRIDNFYEKGCAAGAAGGKLLGAGGGGFLAFLAPPDRHAALREALSELRHIPVRFETSGTTVFLYDDPI